MILQNSGILIILVHPPGDQYVGTAPGYSTSHASNQHRRRIRDSAIFLLRVSHIVYPFGVKWSHVKIMHRGFSYDLSITIISSFFSMGAIGGITLHVSHLRPDTRPVNLVQKRIGRFKSAISVVG